MASVKWLTRIQLIATKFQGPFQSHEYVYLPHPNAYGQAVPVTLQKVNSVITHPVADQVLAPGPVPVRGLAWDGALPLNHVEVSLDEGRTRHQADLVGPAAPWDAEGYGNNETDQVSFRISE